MAPTAWIAVNVESHPSRGAWIEIVSMPVWRTPLQVAPLTGCVDRNMFGALNMEKLVMSHPSRGAWIEIFSCLNKAACPSVAPLTGCVDRNLKIGDILLPFVRRTPHGVRG